ncbi:M15 family metallopeptidase [Thomasclavelia saccharogumia]|uniref:M15 family metallopeptidase n=1 Tax=Thomasclavelia saccharogumia TaxID=341225 RepID=UPI000ABB65C0|nr:M15 family metallopeptidase [Thomasclavelia saccharogumia]
MKRIVVCLVVIIGYIIGFNYFIRENSSKNKVLKTEAIEEKQIINDELLTLVNYKNKIPDDWKVNLVSLNDQQSIDQRAYQELKNMLNDAKKQGLDIIICSSYRTYDRQKELFVNKIKEYLKAGYGYNEAQEAASMWVAKPNMSEHQLGLAVDLVSKKNQRLDDSQERTAEQQWLIKNCWQYGFILRYPANKSDLTKVGYEPWHYRYVGKEHAKKIVEQGMCLEEYLNNLLND